MKCPECESTEIWDLDCTECEASGVAFDDPDCDCMECDGMGYIVGQYECGQYHHIGCESDFAGDDNG